MITIYGSDGTAKVQVPCDDNSTQAKELQGENVLTLSFTLYGHVALEVNDYAEFMGERYWLMERYKPEQVSTAEWKYDVKLYGIESLLQRFLVLNDTDGADEPVFTLTAPPSEHLALIVKSLNEGMDGCVRFEAGEAVGTGNVVIDYDGKYCGDALKELADAAGVKAEWWFDGLTLNLSRCERGEEVTLGYGKGLTGISCDTADNAKIYTRLYPLGSTRNIDPEKYGHTRLQLPDGAKHVDVNVEKYGVWHRFEEAAFKDIYPKYTGTVGSVRSEEVTGEDGEPFTVWYFKDAALPFDPDEYLMAGKVMRVSFQEGSELAGLGNEEDGTYYFEANWHADTGEFEIITVWPYGDGTQLPNGTLCPKAGDKYIPWNIRMPDEYYPAAEQEFKEAVDRYNAENATDAARYKGPTDHVYIEGKDIELYLGRRVRLESSRYFPDTGFRSSRITKITRKVNLPSQMDIEICDTRSTGTLEAINDSIDDAKSYMKTAVGNFPKVLKTGDTDRPTEYNVLSALRSLGTLLRKDAQDATNFLMKFLGGIEVGEFIDSMLAGKGTGITADGRIQTDRLEVRGSMTVMDLIINQIQGMVSDYSFSEIGKIAQVDGLGDSTYKLWIEKRTEFDFTKFQENDVCFSIVNTLYTGGTDYYTSWMRVLAVNATDNALTVVLYSDNEVPGGKNYAPIAGYNLTRRGNATIPDTEAGETNERAQSWLLSSSEGRIMFLVNVFKPILEDWNYGVVIGKLPKTKEMEQIPVAEDDLGIMADVVIARKFYEFDGNGKLVTKIVDRGQWSLDVAQSTTPYRYMTHEWSNPSTGQNFVTLEQHAVWHLGCKWGCLIDKTQLEPKWNSTDWVMLEGDPNYYLQIESSNGYAFRRSNVNTDLTARIYYGNIEITADIMNTAGAEVEWLRDTGNTADDNTWQPAYVDGQKNVIHVDNGNENGVGSGFGVDYTEAAFTCRVFIPVGGTSQEMMKIEGQIKFT